MNNGSIQDKATVSNRRRIMVLMVVLLVIMISFFAGRYSVHRPPLHDSSIGVSTGDPSGRQGIPPDSLPH